MQSFTRGLIIGLEGGGSVIFQWNPSGIDGPNAQADWQAIPTPGAEIPGVEFVSGGVPHIRFDMMLSRTDSDGQVDAMVESLRALTKPVVKGQGKDRPSRVKLILGTRRWTCVLLEVNPRFEHSFHPLTLQPFFARVSLLFWVVES